MLQATPVRRCEAWPSTSYGPSETDGNQNHDYLAICSSWRSARNRRCVKLSRRSGSSQCTSRVMASMFSKPSVQLLSSCGIQSLSFRQGLLCDVAGTRSRSIAVSGQRRVEEAQGVEDVQERGLDVEFQEEGLSERDEEGLGEERMASMVRQPVQVSNNLFMST